MQHNIELTPLHSFGFIYVAFAHQTDGVLTIDELRAVWRAAKKWAQKNRTYTEFAQVMDEVMDWYRTQLERNTVLDTALEQARIIADYDWFIQQKKMESLEDLRKIALADRKFIDNEEDWIFQIAHVWGIDKRSLRRIFRKTHK